MVQGDSLKSFFRTLLLFHYNLIGKLASVEFAMRITEIYTKAHRSELPVYAFIIS